MARKKKTSEDEPNNENLSTNSDSDDTFGLPDIEYKPLNREESSASPVEEQPREVVQQETPRFETEQKPMEQNQNTDFTYEPEEDETPVWPKVVGILFVIALALGAVWYFFSYRPAQEIAKKAEIARIEKEKLEREAQEERDRQAREAAQHVADSLANASKVGVVETLTERTGRYYVVIASAVDDDLLFDNAKKLSEQGVSTKIIPPFSKYKLFRMAIADGDTFASAQEIANSKKAEFGDAVWVLKY